MAESYSRYIMYVLMYMPGRRTRLSSRVQPGMQAEGYGTLGGFYFYLPHRPSRVRASVGASVRKKGGRGMNGQAREGK